MGKLEGEWKSALMELLFREPCRSSYNMVEHEADAMLFLIAKSAL